MTPAQPTTPNDRLLKPFVIAAAAVLLVTIIGITGSASLLVLDRVLRDGPLLLWWMIAAGGYGHWPTVWLAPKDSPRSLQKVTGVGVGFGIISLLTLGLGTAGVLNTTTAYGLLVVGTLIFPWQELLKSIGNSGDVPPSSLVPKGRGTEGEGSALATASVPSDAPSTPKTPLPPSLSPGYREEGGRTSSSSRITPIAHSPLSRVAPIAFAWLPLIAVAGVMLIAACVPPGFLWTDEPHGYDVVEYHLQVPREWYELGRISPLDHNVFSYLPMNVEMHYLLAMHLKGGPWAGMYLAQLMNGVFILIMIATLFFAVGWPAAMVAAAVPWLTMLGSICYVEAGQLMWATLAMVWLLPKLCSPASGMRGEGLDQADAGTISNASTAKILTSQPWGTGALAGICAGFACGAKLTSVPMLVCALPVAMLIARFVPSPSDSAERVSGRAQRADNAFQEKTPLTSALSPEHNAEEKRNPWLALFSRSLAFGLIALLVFSPWLIRTFTATHNPIFPEAMHVFGRGPFTEIQQQRWEQSQRPVQTHGIDRPGSSMPAPLASVVGCTAAVWQQILGDWRWGYLLLPVGTIAIAKQFKRNRVLLWIILFQLLFWLFFTHQQGRFALLALPVIAIAVGQIDSVAWRRMVTAVAVVMCVAGAVPLLQRLAPFVGVLGADIKDLRVLLPPQAVDAIDADKPLALIGDAKAFWYPVPMSKLHYRTVFDVKATPEQSAVDHWLDPEDTSGAVRIVDEGELQRFARTYYGLPKAP